MLAFRAAGFIATRGVRLIAGRQNSVTAELQLKARYAGKSARRGTNLRRKVGQGGNVVAVREGSRSPCKRSPTVCMPSPESPAKRTTADSIALKESVGGVMC